VIPRPAGPVIPRRAERAPVAVAETAADGPRPRDARLIGERRTTLAERALSRWGVALLLVGIGGLVAVYLTLVDLSQGQVPLACATSGIVNCDLVTTSAESRVGPVPVAILGVVWFVAMLGLLLSEQRLPILGPNGAQLAWTGIGLLMVFYLIYAELFLIGAICVWCSVVHVVVIGLFLLTLSRLGAVG
jgi:uncharacterized membrane protein